MLDLACCFLEARRPIGRCTCTTSTEATGEATSLGRQCRCPAGLLPCPAWHSVHHGALLYLASTETHGLRHHSHAAGPGWPSTDTRRHVTRGLCAWAIRRMCSLAWSCSTAGIWWVDNVASKPQTWHSQEKPGTSYLQQGFLSGPLSPESLLHPLKASVPIRLVHVCTGSPDHQYNQRVPFHGPPNGHEEPHTAKSATGLAPEMDACHPPDAAQGLPVQHWQGPAPLHPTAHAAISSTFLGVSKDDRRRVRVRGCKQCSKHAAFIQVRLPTKNLVFEHWGP